MKNRIPILIAALCLILGSGTYLLLNNRTAEIQNIILISIDTCRADYLSCYGYPQETTPHIDAFAKESTLFEHTVSPVPITLPAHSSMLTGTIPPFHGVHNNVDYQLAPANETLQEILKRNGFNTAAIVSTFVLDKTRGLAQGFNTYDDSFEETETTSRFGNERKGKETTDVALKWLEQNKADPSFLFLHYYDPHQDYAPPEPFASAFPDNPYAGEIAFTDHCIGRVISKLKELELYDSALIIITGDHGEMLGEHGEDEHSYFIYEAAIKVPLLIKLPGQDEALRIPDPVALVDLAPTVCSLLGITMSQPVQGQDISALIKGDVPEDYARYIYSESMEPTRIGASSLMSISTGKWKYIQAPRREIYDLYADAREENNLIQQEVHRARILEDKLWETLEQSMRKDLDSRIQLDAESVKRLQSLGYVAGKADGEMAYDETQTDPKDLIHFFAKYQEALILVESNDDDKAKAILTQLVPEHPEFHELYIQLGDIGMRQQDFEQAIINYRKAVQIDDSKPMSLNNLAWLQATRPSLPVCDLDEAVLMAEKLCKITNYNNPNALDTLAVAYAANKNYPKAVYIAERAVKLARAANDKKLIQKLNSRLRLYEQSKPYQE